MVEKPSRTLSTLMFELSLSISSKIPSLGKLYEVKSQPPRQPLWANARGGGEGVKQLELAETLFKQ